MPRVKKHSVVKDNDFKIVSVTERTLADLEDEMKRAHSFDIGRMSETKSRLEEAHTATLRLLRMIEGHIEMYNSLLQKSLSRAREL